MEISQILSRLGKNLSEYIKPDQPRDIPPSMVSAMELTKNNLFAGFFSYRNYDDKAGLIHLDDGKTPSVGLIFTYTTSGDLEYPQLESDLMSLLEVLPVGSTMQTSGFVSTKPNISTPKPSSHPLVEYVNTSRFKAFDHAVDKQRTISEKQGYLVSITNYISFRIPFEGDVKDSDDIAEFMEAIDSYKEAVIDSLSKHKVYARTLTAYEFKLLLRTLLNYATPHEVLEQKTKNNQIFHSELVLGTTEYNCKIAGGLEVTDHSIEGQPLQAHVATLTCDAFSHDITMKARSSVHMSKDTPAPAIQADYWVYSTYLKLADDALNESITQYISIHSASNKNKVDLESSIWHQKSLKHLLGGSGSASESGIVAKAYTGITLYANNATVLEEAKNTMLQQYNALGYRAAEEMYISLLALVCSLPFQLTLEYEHAQKGFRRANIMPQARALAISHIPDVWYGANPESKGTLHLTRQGLVGRFGFFDEGIKDTVIMARSDFERNTYLKEVLLNALTTKTPLVVIEQSNQLAMLSSAMGWKYETASETSLPNPYGGITTKDWLETAQAHLVPLTLDLAYPTGIDATVKAQLKYIVEAGINEAWSVNKERLTLRHIFDSILNTAKSKPENDRDLYLSLLQGLGSLLELPEAKFLSKSMPQAISTPNTEITVWSLKAVAHSSLMLVLAYLAYNHSILTSSCQLRKPLAIVHNALHPVYKNLLGHGLEDISRFSHVKWIVTIDSLVVAQEMEFLKEVLFKAKLFVSSSLDLRSKAVEGITPLLTLTPEEFKMMESLQNTKSHIEGFIKYENTSNIFLFTPDMQSKLIFTTAPVELAMIEDNLNKHSDLYSAINAIVKGS